jgi:hypothetical protein
MMEQVILTHFLPSVANNTQETFHRGANPLKNHARTYIRDQKDTAVVVEHKLLKHIKTNNNHTDQSSI